MDSDDRVRENDTRSLLMDAAYHTLCEDGYAEFSLRKVPGNAGKSRGLVHYHYESKNDLLASLLDDLIERFEAQFEDSEARSAIERLDKVLGWVAFGRALFGRDGRDYFTVMF